MAEPTKYGWKSLGEIMRTFTAVIGVLTIIGTPVWTYILRPALVMSVSTAMAQTVEQKIDEAMAKKVSPINTGLKALIQGNISKLQERIDVLEYKRDFMPTSWSNMDREELYSLNQELKVQHDALNSILSSERATN